MCAKTLSVVKAIGNAKGSSVNHAVLSPDEDFGGKITFKQVKLGYQSHYNCLLVTSSTQVAKGTVRISSEQFKWLRCKEGDIVDVTPILEGKKMDSILIEVVCQDPKVKKSFNCNRTTLSSEFYRTWKNKVMLKGQILILKFEGKTLLLTVKDLKGSDGNVAIDGTPINGLLISSTKINFEEGENPKLRLVPVINPKSTSPTNNPSDTPTEGSGVGDEFDDTASSPTPGVTDPPSAINPRFDFRKLGFGGYEKQFHAIMDRLATRFFPQTLIESLGCQHVRGVLLYGPPGMGKTRMARQFANMLTDREPVIVSGPQILNMYVGESEKSIRELFDDAFEDQRLHGANSKLHVIIIDEFEAIAKARGERRGDAGSDTDSIVNQLLPMIDGPIQLNNILVICMTNHKEIIDDALLRPGRIEIHEEMGLPNEASRLEILKFHTAQLRANKKLAGDVNLFQLAKQTNNYSAAEIAALVRAAVAGALKPYFKITNTVEVDMMGAGEMKVELKDFSDALKNIKPAFSNSGELIDYFTSQGIIDWGKPFQIVIDRLLEIVNRVLKRPIVASVLMEGPSGAGKTALAAHFSKLFPVVQICTPHTMLDFSEDSKSAHICKFLRNATSVETSCIFIDDLERLLEYSPLGPFYSNKVLQTLMVAINEKNPLMKGRHLLILCTSSNKQLLADLAMVPCFSTVIHVPKLSSLDHLTAVLTKSEAFPTDQIEKLRSSFAKKPVNIGIRQVMKLVSIAEDDNKDERIQKLITRLDELE